jgi:hypothetical protein
MKPHELKTQGQNKDEKREKTKDDKKVNKNQEKAIKH